MPPRINTILLVEDDTDIRESLAAILEEEGYAVVAACHALDAQRLLATVAELPAAVVLDLMMPIMNGREFLDWLRMKPMWRTLPVCVGSALATEKIPAAEASLGSHSMRVRCCGSSRGCACHQ